MKRPTLGSGITVFASFFGVGILEAFQGGNWLKAAFWLAVGFAFLVMDNRSSRQHN